LEIISQLHVMPCTKATLETMWEELIQSYFFQMFPSADRNIQINIYVIY
jgi:hypothetical protein